MERDTKYHTKGGMNGIIINDELHELVSVKDASPCDNCSLKEICDAYDELLLCDDITMKRTPDERFINRGNVKEFIEKQNNGDRRG